MMSPIYFTLIYTTTSIERTHNQVFFSHISHISHISHSTTILQDHFMTTICHDNPILPYKPCRHTLHSEGELHPSRMSREEGWVSQFTLTSTSLTTQAFRGTIFHVSVSKHNILSTFSDFYDCLVGAGLTCAGPTFYEGKEPF